MKSIVALALIVLMLSIVGCGKEQDKSQPQLDTLFSAADYGDSAAIQKLITSGKPVDELDQYGRTPLAYAVMGHHLSATQMLISLGANKDFRTDKGYDLVMLSLYHTKDTSLELLNYLVSLGLPIDNRTADGDSALNIAISSSNEAAVLRLIALGAKPNAKSIDIMRESSGLSPLIVKAVIEQVPKAQASMPRSTPEQISGKQGQVGAPH